MWSRIYRLKLMAFWMDFLFFLQKFLNYILHLTKPVKLVTLWNHSDEIDQSISLLKYDILVLMVNSKERNLRLKKQTILLLSPPATLIFLMLTYMNLIVIPLL